jgi:hypothetical protein
MKLLFGLLFSLSIGLFAFMQWGGVPTDSSKGEQAQREVNPEKLLLLTAPLTLPSISSVAASTVIPAAASATVSDSATHSSSVADVMPEIIHASRPAPLPMSAPVASSPLPPAPTPHKALPTTAPQAALGKVTATKVCMEWGEFSGSDLERAKQALDIINLRSHLTQRSVEYASGYWVYIPPLPNKAAIHKKIEQLKAKGVEDYFVVQAPATWANSISLGVFKTKSAALKFQSGLKKKGVKTATVIERKHKLKFIVFRLNGLDAAAQKQLKRLQKDFTNSELAQISCVQ